MDTVRVLIADDHPMFRRGVRELLEDLPAYTLAGEATSGEEAVAMAAELQPDVILMDIRMPGLNGIDAARRILAASPHVRVLMVTMFEDDASIFTAMRAGARGYILKDAAEEELLRAISAVAGGEAIFSPTVAARVIDYFAEPKPATPQDAFPELTEREREILNLVAGGLSNGEIAERLVLSLKTVRNHISNIFSKLQVADRARAIIRAREAGLGRS